MSMDHAAMLGITVWAILGIAFAVGWLISLVENEKVRGLLFALLVCFIFAWGFFGIFWLVGTRYM